MNVGTHHVGNSRLAGEFLSRPLAFADRHRNGAAITRAAFEQHRGKEGEAARYLGPKKKHRRRRHPAHPRNGRTASRSWLRWLMAILAATFVSQVGEAFEQNSGRVCQIAGYQGESCRPGLSISVRIRDKDQTYDNSYAAVREAPLEIVAGDEFYGRKLGEGSRRIYRGSGRQPRERSLFPAPTTTRPGPATTTVATVPVAKQVQGRWTSSFRPGAGRSITITGKLNNQSNSYLLTWGISTGNVTRYELRRWKAPLGSRGESAYMLDATITISAFRAYHVEIGMSHGRYMYRVAACNNNGCGSLGPRSEVLVYPPLPGRGAEPFVNTSDQSNVYDGTYWVRWDASSGTVDRYELEMQTSLSGPWVRIYKGTRRYHYQDVGVGSRRYRVQACNISGCGEFGTASRTIDVEGPPGRGAQPFVNESDQSNVYDGTYWVRWDASSGTVDRYELEMQTSLSGPWVRIYKGTRRYHYQDVGVGSRRYRVQACNIPGCGGFGDPSEPIVVEGPPDPGARPYVNASDLSDSYDGTYVVRWDASSGTVERYELEMQMPPSEDWVRIYEGTGRYYSQNTGVGNRRYQVRACNPKGCGDYSEPSGIIRVKPPRVATGTIVTLSSSISRNVQTSTGQLTYAWEQLCGPSVTLTNANTAQPTFTATTASANGTGLTRGRIPYLPSGVASFPVYTTFTFQLAVTDAENNRKTDRVSVTATPNATLASPPAADTLKGKCVMPRLANEIQGTALDERKWLRSWIHENYLWYDEVVDHNPASHDNADTYFGLMRTFAEATSCGKPKGAFHFTIKTAATSSTSARMGASDAGIGAVFGQISSRVYVDFVHANSPSASVALTNDAGDQVATGLMRGDRVTEVDGTRLDSSSIASVLGVLNKISTGETRVLKIARTGITGTLTASITTATYVINPVPLYKVVPRGADKVGYLQFDRHIEAAEGRLIKAINAFDRENINDLVLDLRYNRGGLAYISNRLATMIAQRSKTRNKTYLRLVFNDKRSDSNDPFNPSRGRTLLMGEEGTTGTRGDALPILGLNRLFVLTTKSTCSASEALINGLRGVGIKVIQIGETTCGKPYGFGSIPYPRSGSNFNCGTIYNAIDFIAVNDEGFGEYQHGFAPENGSGLREHTVTLPGCWVDYAAPVHPLGNENERLFAAALAYRSNNDTCPTSTSSRSRSPARTRETYELTPRELPPWGGMIVD